jgi:hypothetical protein
MHVCALQIRTCLAEHSVTVDDHGGLDGMMDALANQTEPVCQSPAGCLLMLVLAVVPPDPGIPAAALVLQHQACPTL